MKTWSIVLATVMAFILTVGIADAAKAGKAAKPLQGTISKIDGNTLTITPKAAKGSTEAAADVTVTTDDKTTVTIKGETKTVADLTAGLKVRVTLGEDGKTATAITSGKVPAAATSPATNP